MNRASVTCGTVSSGLMCNLSLRGFREGSDKMIADENCKSTNTRNSMNFKQDQCKENHTKAYHNQITES